MPTTLASCGYAPRMTSEYVLEATTPPAPSKLPSAAAAAKALHKAAPTVIASLSLDPTMRTPEGTKIETKVAARLGDVKAISEKYIVPGETALKIAR